MIFQFTDKLTPISADKISADILTACYVTSDELNELNKHFGFAESTVAACGSTNKYFRSGVETYSDYTFTELRVTGDTPEDDDWIALYIKKNLIIVVDVLDSDGSTKNKFMSALNRYSPDNATLEKIIFAFLDALVAGGNKVIEDYGTALSDLEEQLLNNDVDDSFNRSLLEIKKRLLRLHNYYEQILDITQSIDENENEVFDYDKLMYISNINRRIERLREDTDSLKNTVDHLHDAFFSYQDTRLNNTMKVLTVITTIFFPLTIVVGWYGMNFANMPELTWKFGYLYVTILSIVVVVALWLFGKRKNWFK